MMKSTCALALLLVSITSVFGAQPVLFFPGYSLSKLFVTVNNGSEPGCPANGNFTVEYQMQRTQNNFTEECMMNYLSLSYNPSASRRFANRPDVSISIPGRESGNTQCFGSPLYTNMTNFFVSKGYTINNANASFLAACFDWRMDPSNDAIAGPTFMENTRALVEQAYASNGNQKVWLIGHSNGPIMILYFLNQLTDAYKSQYIAGFIPISGNFAGQGLFPVVYVEGLSVHDFSFFLPSAEAHRGWPGNYFSGPQPEVFTGANNLSFLQTNTPARQFYVTEQDLDAFYTLSNNSFGHENWDTYAGLVGPHTPPDVYTFALWGNNVSTLYGLHIESFANVSIEDYFYRNGDGNQEDIDNESVLGWNSTMPAGCFDHWVVDNVDHFQLTYNQIVLDRIFQVISAPRNISCVSSSSSSTTSSSSSSSTSTSSPATTTATSASSSLSVFSVLSLAVIGAFAL